MSKLTKATKEHIARNVVRSLTNNLRIDLDASLLELSDQVYHAFVTPEMEKYFSSLPEGFLHSSLSIKYSFNDFAYFTDMSQSRRLPYQLHNIWGGFNIAGTTAEPYYMTYISKENSFTAFKSDVMEKVWGILNSVSTEKQLRVAWPEGAIYYDACFPSRVNTGYLPAVILDDLNAMSKHAIKEV